MSTTHSAPPDTRRSRTGLQIVAGVVLAPVLMFLAGWVTAISLSEGSAVLGGLLALALTAATVVVAARWSVMGITAGAIAAATMLVFLVLTASANDRPAVDLAGMVSLGASGILTAAVAAAALTVGLIRR